MIENKFWKPIKSKDVPADSKLISTTWSMKTKASGKYRVRLSARGFLQEVGMYYFIHSTAAPVANDLQKILPTFLVLNN
jgi:hypothetical protein